MKPMKFKKKTDEGNWLGWDEIILIDRQLDKVMHHKDLPTCCADETMPGDVYWYSFLCIVDGCFSLISEHDWEVIEFCYEYVKE